MIIIIAFKLLIWGSGVLMNILNSFQVFLDPLKRVVSSSAVDNLLQCCVTQAQRTLLQAIGIASGIKSWTDDFKIMVKESKTTIKKADDHSLLVQSPGAESKPAHDIHAHVRVV